MFLSNYMMIFNVILIGFSFVTINFNSLFFTWVFMELNLLMVSPLLLMKSSFSKEQPTLILKYFLVQVIGSLFILSTLTFFKNSLVPPLAINFVLLLALLLKAGIPPLHFWFPPMVYLSNPYQSFMLLCAQKIIPLFLIASLSSEVLLSLITVSAVLGGISGIPQNSLMKILAYSSMVHSGWMLAGMAINTISGYFYFLVYSMLSLSILMLMVNSSMKFVSEMVNDPKTITMKTLIIMIIFTLSGTPPFIGFFSKIYVMKGVMTYSLYWVALFLVLGSTLSFFFYARMVISISLLYHTSQKEKNFNKMFNSPLLLAILTNTALFPVLFLVD